MSRDTKSADQSAAAVKEKEKEKAEDNSVQNQDAAELNEAVDEAVDEVAPVDNAADSTVEDADENTAEDAAEEDAAEEDTAEESVAEEDTAENEEGPHLSIVPIEPLDAERIRCVVEATLLAADDAVTLDRLYKIFIPGELDDDEGKAQVVAALADLEAACEGRGFELKQVASGYRLQVRQNFSPWVSRLWEEKPPRYTRALLETMALIAYRQPATRGDIEEVRGVTVSSNIMRTLLERGWIREVGHRDVPGRPSMYATTKEFLDYFNLKSLDELPSLPEVRELVEPAAQVADDVLGEREESRSEATKALLAERAEDEEAEDGVVPDGETDQADQAEEAAGSEQEQEEQEAESQDVAISPDHVDGDPEELKSVPATGDGTENNANKTVNAAPVFADNEVLVVNESVSVEVTNEATLATLPSADAKD